MDSKKSNEKPDLVTIISEEIIKLGEHIKTYSVGAFPVLMWYKKS